MLPEQPGLIETLGFFKVLLDRDFSPEKYILVERINKTPALESPYAEVLLAFGFERSYKGLELTKKY